MIPLSVELQFSATGAIYRRLTGNRGHGLDVPIRTGRDDRVSCQNSGLRHGDGGSGRGVTVAARARGRQVPHRYGYAAPADRHTAPGRAELLPQKTSAVDVEICFAAPSMG